jgi:hypothetical protein
MERVRNAAQRLKGGAIAGERRLLASTLIVPAMYNLCLLDPEFDRFDLSAWRVGGYGVIGAPA